MSRLVTAGFSVLLLVFLIGCNESVGSNRQKSSPHLMQSGSVLRGLDHPVRHTTTPRTLSYPEDAALKLRRMELAHQERLAAIEAEKAKALKALELEKLRSTEELRRRTAEIEAEKALKLEEEKRKYAALIAEKEKAIKALEANVSLQHDQTRTHITQLRSTTEKNIAMIRGKYEEAIALLQNKLKEKTLWVFTGLLLLLLLLGFLFYRYRKGLEREAREEERRHEAMILERRLRHEEVEKVLEIIASEQTDESVKIELARLLQKGIIDGDDPKLLEYKQDREDKSPE